MKAVVAIVRGLSCEGTRGDEEANRDAAGYSGGVPYPLSVDFIIDVVWPDDISTLIDDLVGVTTGQRGEEGRDWEGACRIGVAADMSLGADAMVFEVFLDGQHLRHLNQGMLNGVRRTEVQVVSMATEAYLQRMAFEGFEAKELVRLHTSEGAGERDWADWIERQRV